MSDSTCVCVCVCVCVCASLNLSSKRTLDLEKTKFLNAKTVHKATYLVSWSSGQDELAVRIEWQTVDLCCVGIHCVTRFVGGVWPCVPAEKEDHLLDWGWLGFLLILILAHTPPSPMQFFPPPSNQNSHWQTFLNVHRKIARNSSILTKPLKYRFVF